jgi:hypothetical protein
MDHRTLPTAMLLGDFVKKTHRYSKPMENHHYEQLLIHVQLISALKDRILCAAEVSSDLTTPPATLPHRNA